MKFRLQQCKSINKYVKVVTLFSCISLIGFACQNKKATKAMSEENINKQPADSGRLLSVANLEQTDSGRRAMVWFFETPQVFEFSLDSGQSQQIYKLIKEAKEKQLPVNIHSTAIQGKNIIDKAIPATSTQINNYNKEKAERQQPVSVPPPPHN
jgi:hypothetical protein